MKQQQKGMEKWLVMLAYISVVFIWSTTPVTIKWSAEGAGFLFGILVRMIIGAIVAVTLVMLLYRKIPFSRSSCNAYAGVALMLFGGMMLVYWGAQYISSGLVSVIFGLTPIVTGYFSWRFIQEQSMSPMKIAGALAGITGLLVIFSEDVSLNNDYIYGILAMILAVLMHSISAVWVKSLKVDMPALTLVAGGLVFSMPAFVSVYLIFAPDLPAVIPGRAIWSILYLGVVGSVLGFVCYYYLLKRLATSSVALITLITPVMALYIGYVFNHENISRSIILGTICVLIGLAMHQWGDAFSKRYFKRNKSFLE